MSKTKTVYRLLSCPFCGSDDVKVSKIYARVRAYSAVCHCHCCFASAGDRETEKQAAAAWNTRANELIGGQDG